MVYNEESKSCTFRYLGNIIMVSDPRRYYSLTEFLSAKGNKQKGVNIFSLLKSLLDLNFSHSTIKPITLNHFGFGSSILKSVLFIIQFYVIHSRWSFKIFGFGHLDFKNQKL